MKGSWNLSADSISFNINPESVNSRFEYYNKSADEEKLKNLDRQFKDLSPEIMQEFINAISDTHTMINLDDNNLEFAEFKMEKVVGGNKLVILMEVTEETGFMPENGYSGQKFVVLEYGGWNCIDGTIEGFEKAVESGKDSPKCITLLPYSMDEDGHDVLSAPISIDAPAGYLGVHVKDVSVGNYYFLYNIFPRYQMTK